MKIQNVSPSFLTMAVITLAVAAVDVSAQDVVVIGDTPQLSYGVPAILELSQAKMADDIIIRYIQNSGTIFALKAPELVYLKEQGVSDAVLNAMLDQRRRITGSTEPSLPATVTASATTSPSTVQPIYAVTPREPMVYVIPDTQTRRYNHEYGGYPYSARYGNGFEWPYGDRSYYPADYSTVSVTIHLRNYSDGYVRNRAAWH